MVDRSWGQQTDPLEPIQWPPRDTTAAPGTLPATTVQFTPSVTEAFSRVMSALEQLTPEQRKRVFDTVRILLDVRLPGIAQAIADEGAKLTALQSRVRECITELRATGGDKNVLAWLERGLVESEKAGTNG